MNVGPGGPGGPMGPGPMGPGPMGPMGGGGGPNMGGGGGAQQAQILQVGYSFFKSTLKSSGTQITLSLELDLIPLTIQ